MTAWLLLVAWVWPLLLAGMQGQAPWSAGRAKWRTASLALGPLRASLLWLAPLPALVAALTVPVGSTLTLPWLVLGTTLVLDETARVYLLFTSILWLVAGIHAAWEFRANPHGRRFAALFLLAMAGNLWLIVGADLVSFYAGFAMMGLAAYGLVIHDASPAALRAGRVYLVLALVGEVCLFAAILLVVADTGTVTPGPADLTNLTPLTLGLALVGLGVKAGLVPLHLWLPLAHPAAPVPASAVLSGTMIKVALLGWMRLLPVGEAALPGWGAGFALAGLVTLGLALPVGLTQRDPKVILAYSSVAKMGLMVLLFGLILMEPALAPVGIAALVFYAAFHALAKGGLFLGVGLRKHAGRQPWVLGGLVFLALALAGAPFTSGAVAKYATKPIIDATQWTWIGAVLSLATIGTTLLLARFVQVCVATPTHTEPGWRWPLAAWGVLIGLSAVLPFALGTPTAWLTNALWVPLGIAIAAAVWWFIAKGTGTRTSGIEGRLRGLLLALPGRIPPGDLLALLAPVLAALARLWNGWCQQLGAAYDRVATALARRGAALIRPQASPAELLLARWPVAGTLWVGLVLLLLWAVVGGRPPDADPSAVPSADRGAEPLADEDRPPAATAPEQPPARPAREPSAGVTEPIAAPSSEPADPIVTHAPEVPGAPPIPLPPAPPPPLLPEVPPELPPELPPESPPASPVTLSPELPVELPPESPTALPVASPAPVASSDPCEPYQFGTDGGTLLPVPRCDDADDGTTPSPLARPTATAALITAVQQALAERGHDPGPIDGLMGPRTRAALRAFQQAQDLPVDGTISFSLLDRLQRATKQAADTGTEPKPEPDPGPNQDP